MLFTCTQVEAGNDNKRRKAVKTHNKLISFLVC